MIVVHLPGVRNDGNGICFGQRGNLARLGDAADAVGVELDVVERAGFEQVAEAIEVNSCSPPAIGIRPYDFNSA